MSAVDNFIRRGHSAHDKAASHHASSSPQLLGPPHLGHSAINSATPLVRMVDEKECALLRAVINIIRKHVS
jgi:hypothetical protein